MKLFLILLMLVISFDSHSSKTVNDMQEIQQVLKSYINGTSYNDQQQIKSAFADNAQLLLDKKGHDFLSVPATEYATWFKETHKGKFNGRIGEIRSIELDGNIASAKVEVLVPDKGKRFVDLLLLKSCSQAGR